MPKEKSQESLKNSLFNFLEEKVDYLIYVVALVVLIGMVTQTSLKVKENVEEVLLRQIQMQNAELKVVLDLTSGANKPAILTREGRALLEYSAWESYITVNGDGKSLWHHKFNYKENPYKSIVYYTMGTENYQLEEIVELDGKIVKVSYYFITNDFDIKLVRLSLSHYRWYMNEVEKFDSWITISLDEKFATRKENRASSSRIFLKMSKAPINFYVNSTDKGINYFTTEYILENPLPGKRILIVEETLTLQREGRVTSARS